MKKLFLLLSTLLCGCAISSSGDYSANSPKKTTIQTGVDFTQIRKVNPGIQIFVNTDLIYDDIVSMTPGSSVAIRYCSMPVSTSNIWYEQDESRTCIGFVFEKPLNDNTITIFKEEYLDFNKIHYNIPSDVDGNTLFCNGNPDQNPENIVYCLAPYPIEFSGLRRVKNIKSTSKFYRIYEREAEATYKKDVETALDLYNDYYLAPFFAGDDTGYYCKGPNGSDVIDGGKISEIEFNSFLPILQSMSLPDINYKCFVHTNASNLYLDKNKDKYVSSRKLASIEPEPSGPIYLNQTDECILARRNTKDSKVCFFNYKKYLPENSKINDDDDFLFLLNTHLSLKQQYNPEKIISYECDTKKEMTTQEREECKVQEASARQKLKKQQHAFLEQISTNTVPLCKKKEPENYKEFINTYKCKDVTFKAIKAFEYKNLCYATDAKKDVKDLSTKECSSIMAHKTCVQYSFVVMSAVEWCRQGTSISVPLDTIKYTPGRYAGIDEYLFLRKSVESAYANPGKMAAEIQNGNWVSSCEKALLNQ